MSTSMLLAPPWALELRSLRLLALALLLALGASASVAESSDPDSANVDPADPHRAEVRESPTPASVEMRDVSGHRQLRIEVPGRPRAPVLVAAAAASDQPKLVALLTRGIEEPKPRTLYIADSAAQTLREIPLPERAATLKTLQRPGQPDLLLIGRPGEIFSWNPAAPDSAPTSLLQANWADLSGRQGPRDALWLSLPGKLRKLETSPAGSLQIAEDEILPLRAEREERGLKLFTPPTQVLSRPDLPPLLIVGPEAVGKQRLRTVVIDPSKEGEERRWESWSLLPGPEEVLSSTYMLQDGKPVLVVLAHDSEKLNILARKRLRVFALRPDRSRAGRRPGLEHLTASRPWQEAQPFMLDVDGDGHQDLVLLQPEGMDGDKLILEAFLGRGSARFQRRGSGYATLRTLVKVKARSWRYGEDLDNDGIPDLIMLNEDSLQIFPGARPSEKRRKRQPVVEKVARWTLPLGLEPREERASVEVSVGGDDSGIETRWGRPALLKPRDLDGDGQPEILLLAASKSRAQVIVQWLPESKPSPTASPTQEAPAQEAPATEAPTE